jgi:histone-lysine N-methyltransferase SETMAR
MDRFEQRVIIKYWWKQGKKPQEIVDLLTENYGTDAYCLRSVYFWIQQLRLGREDLHNIPSPGREPDELIPQAILDVINEDPYASATNIADTLRIALSTVCRYLKDVLGMKYRHMRWVPHTLSADQKQNRVDHAESMLRDLKKHESSGFNFIFTGDESWIFYDNPRKKMWVADVCELDQVQRPSHFAKKVMLTVFFNGRGQCTVDLMPKGCTMDSGYFINNIVPAVALVCYPNGRQPRQRRCVLHFDNAPAHKTKEVGQCLGHYDLLRFEHPPYSPDLAPCDFFLFGYLKTRLQGKQFTTEGDLMSGIRDLIGGIPKDTWRAVFLEWMDRLARCAAMEGDYIE